MSTFAVMKARIVSETLRDDLTATQLNNAVNDAIKQFEAERFVFNEGRYRIMTVQAQEYYDLTSGTLLTSAGAAVGTGETLLELDDITATINSQPYRLCPRTQQGLNDWQTSTYQGQPADYGLYGRQLRIFPLPDAAYQLDLSGLARLSPNPLSADGDTNAWMTEAEPLIRSYAKMLIYRDVLRDNDGASMAVEAVKEAQAMLGRKMAAQAFTGRQRAWSL
jgi:hypothetical protein